MVFASGPYPQAEQVKPVPDSQPSSSDSGPKITSNKAPCDSANGNGYLEYLDWYLSLPNATRSNGRFHPSEPQLRLTCVEWDTNFFKDSGITSSCSSFETSSCEANMVCQAGITYDDEYHAEKFWIQTAIKTFHDNLQAKKQIVQEAVLADSLDIPQKLADDFGVKDKDNAMLDTIMDMLSKALTWGLTNAYKEDQDPDKPKEGEEGKAGFSPGDIIQNSMDMIDALKDLIPSSSPKDADPDDAKKAVKAALANSVRYVDQASLNTAIDFFATPDPKTISAVAYPDKKLQTYKHNVTNFLAGGAYLKPWTGVSENATSTSIRNSLLSSLAATGLVSQNYYIMEGGECTGPSAKTINGKCYALHLPGPRWPGAAIGDPKYFTVPIEDDLANKLASDYAFDFTSIYTLSENCQSSTGKYNSEATATEFNNNLGANGLDLSKSCYFSMSVLYSGSASTGASAFADKTPCAIVNAASKDPKAAKKAGYNYLPQNLQKDPEAGSQGRTGGGNPGMAFCKLPRISVQSLKSVL